MRPHSWTELFFLDEAAALAAGHRPCAACRYADYRRFRTFWIACHGGPGGVDDIDARLHADRVLRDRSKRTYRAGLSDLPDGAYVLFDGIASLVWGDRLFAWSDGGYIARRARPMNVQVDVLTPRSTVAVVSAGYTPQVHPSFEVRRR
jgi:hypothetical protein